MKISFTFSRESLRIGARHYLLHRHLLLTLLIPALGILFIGTGLYHLFLLDESRRVLGFLLTALGAFYLYRSATRTKEMVKNAFASNPNERLVTMETSDEALASKEESSSGSSTWDAFVDYKICKDGILLYPQKNIFYWIPETAAVEGGTWQEFQALVSNKITRRI
jgi:hypothetical protein